MSVEMDLPDDQVRAMWNRRLWSRYVLMYVAMVASAVVYLGGRPPALEAVLVLGMAVVTALLGMRTTFHLRIPLVARLPFWLSYALLLVFCVLLPVFAGSEWVFNSIWANMATGWIGGRWLVARLLTISTALGVIAWFDHLEVFLIGWLALTGLIIGLFTNQARNQYDMFVALQESRRERARLAVAEERDRIARDLHDLVGHSLSVIAVKTELARRLVQADPERAEQELADIDTVVRRALSEVRQAVTNYRQPTLAGELASARRAAASAGIDCRVESPDSWSLPVKSDGALAWTVREGVTNVLRHSRATHCKITLSLDDTFAEVAIVDDGVGPGAPDSGNGLAGLAERAEALGGSLTCGTHDGGQGFYVRVRVPA